MGKEAIHALNTISCQKKLNPNLSMQKVFRMVNQYMLSGSADIGFTSKSTVTFKQANGIGHWIELDEKSYKPIEQES